MRTILNWAILIVLRSDFSHASNCLRCVSSANSTLSTLIGLNGKGLDLTNVPEHPKCHSKADAGDSVSCENSCVTLMTQGSAEGGENWAARSCADTLLSSDLWTSLGMEKTADMSGCSSSSHGATTHTAPASGRVCFCKGDKCNTQLWDAMNSTTNIILSKVLMLTIMFLFIF